MNEENIKKLSDSYSDIKQKYEELLRLAPHAKSCQVRCNNQAREIANLREQVKNLEDKIEKLKVYKDAKVIIPEEGAVILQVDGKMLGAYIPQKKYQEKVEIIKQLKEKYEQRTDS